MLLALSGCARLTEGTRLSLGADPAALQQAAEAAQRLEPPRPNPPRRTNPEIARDILELTFQLESGRPIARLSRFEGPVSIALAGPVPPLARADLDRLIARLRAEAGLDVSVTPSVGQAQIVVAFVPLAQMRRAVPRAACFVVPGVAGWDDFRAQRPGSGTDWASLTRRERLTVFIPADAPPQEVRDCLHEEIGQALGPLNDSYRLTDSVFNDDNLQTVLTGFDMLVLRVLNDPGLKAGMPMAEVRGRLPEILARLNPAGGAGADPALPRPTPRIWTEAMEIALSPDVSDATRRAAITRAIEIARAEGWRDNRAAFGLFVRARLLQSDAPVAAAADLLAARALWQDLPDTGAHLAQADLTLAGLALQAGRPDLATPLVSAALPAALAAQNATLAATLLAVQAEAHLRAGQPELAKGRQSESLFWARYGIGGRALAMAPEAIPAPSPSPSPAATQGLSAPLAWPMQP